MAKEFDKNNGKEFKGGRPQYGKKGFTPRKLCEYPTVDMDKQETNDPIYWNRAANFNNVTKFTWPLIIGRGFDLRGMAQIGDARLYSDEAKDVRFPQIMNISFIPGPGWAQDTSQGINRTLARIMSRLRSSLSTSNIGFETADLGLFMTSTATIPMLIAMAKRVIRSRDMWRGKNYIVPKALIKQMGFEYEDIRDNVQTYIGTLNTMIKQYNDMNIPDFSYVYDRHYTLSNNVYADEDSDLAQFYVFSPSHYYKYVDTNSKAVCIDLWSHVAQREANGEKRFGAFLKIIQDCIDAWHFSSDFFQINGVLLRAMKDVPRQHIPNVEIDQVQEYVVDRAITMQIMNMSILGREPITNLDITQDPANPTYIKWMPKTSRYMGSDKFLLRVFEDELTPDDNMEMTRLLNFVYDGGSTDPMSGYLVNCGDMIVNLVSVVTAEAGKDEFDVLQIDSNDVRINQLEIAEGGANSLITMERLLAVMSLTNFRYLPLINVWFEKPQEVDDGTGRNELVHKLVLGDLYQYEIYDYADYKFLQDSAFQSIWEPKFTI